MPDFVKSFKSFHKGIAIHVFTCSDSSSKPIKVLVSVEFFVPRFVFSKTVIKFLICNRSDIQLAKSFSQMVTPCFQVRNLSLASTVFYHLLNLPVWYLYELEKGFCIMTSSSNDVMKYFNLVICIVYLLGQMFPLFLANVSCIWKLAKYQKEQREIGSKAVRTTQVRDQDDASLLTAAQNVTSGVNPQNQQQGCQ